MTTTYSSLAHSATLATPPPSLTRMHTQTRRRQREVGTRGARARALRSARASGVCEADGPGLVAAAAAAAVVATTS